MTATDTLHATQDLLNLAPHLNAEDKLIRGTVRQLVRQDLLYRIARAFQCGHLPDGFISRAGELGLLGMQLEGYGCAGTSAVAYGLACLEPEAGDSGLRRFVSVQGSLAMYAIWSFGSDEQKKAWLPSMAAGEGTDEIPTLAVGSAITGLAPF
jgi:glutaryl-CoA dehydrogenase